MPLTTFSVCMVRKNVDLPAACSSSERRSRSKSSRMLWPHPPMKIWSKLRGVPSMPPLKGVLSNAGLSAPTRASFLSYSPPALSSFAIMPIQVPVRTEALVGLACRARCIDTPNLFARKACHPVGPTSR